MRRFLTFALMAVLVGFVFGGVSSAFKKKRHNIFRLCTDVTESSELELSQACAKRLKLPWNAKKHWTSKRFMAVRIYYIIAFYYLF